MESLNLRSIREVDLKGKVVLMRADHNVVKKGMIHDPYRIDATIPTIFYITAKGGKIILMTHVGRPKDKKTGEIKTGSDSAIEPVVDYLQQKLGISIRIPEFTADGNAGITEIGNKMEEMIKDLKNGKTDMLYLPNTRWFAGEEAKGDLREKFAKELAGLADIYVNDAFGSWQAHASTVHVTKNIPGYAGILMEKEIENLKKIYEPARPLVSVVAGSKFDTKIEPLSALLEKSDHLVLGGVIYNAYLCAKYGITIKGVDEADLEAAKKFVDFASKFPGRIVELPFIVESDTMDGKVDGQYRTHDIRTLKAGTALNFVLDADKKSFSESSVSEVFMNAKTIFVNAVMGFTPHFTEGTIAMDKLIDSNKDAMKLFGGGDTLEELKKLLPGVYMKALDNKKYYFFTGGGAVLTAIEEGTPAGMEPVKVLLK
ncbi:MAG TPA: phosphoglycerate kinase [bacterium]|nr:phosphoglycerate kinase [bacterium]